MDDSQPPLDPQQRKQDMAKCPRWLLERLKQLVESKAEQAEEIENLQQRCQKAEGELESVKKKLHSSEKKLKTRSRELKDAQKSSVLHEKEASELKQELSSLRAKFAVRGPLTDLPGSSSTRELPSDVESLKRLAETYKAENEHLKNKLADLLNKAMGLPREQPTQHGAQIVFRQKEAEIERLRKDIAVKDATIKDLKAKISKKSAKLNDLRAKIRGSKLKMNVVNRGSAEDKSSPGSPPSKVKKKPKSLINMLSSPRKENPATKEPSLDRLDSPKSGKSRKVSTPRSPSSRKKKEEGLESSLSPRGPFIEYSDFESLPEDAKQCLAKAEITEAKATENFELIKFILRFHKKICRKPSDSHKSYELEFDADKEENLIEDVPNIKKHLKVLGQAGKGGFASVLRAKWGKEIVAAKKMENTTDHERVRNLHEIYSLRTYAHPNIVKYIQSYKINGEYWVLMEFLEGGTLAEAAREHTFTEKEISYTTRELLRGIAFLHSQNVAHRDLKSANIMMSTAGQIKMVDFGLCAHIPTERLETVGSPFWMAPEMIKHQPHTVLVDIWSLAVSLLELANGRAPHRENGIKAMYLVATEGIQSPLEDTERWSDSFKSFLKFSLQTDPCKRASAEQLLSHPFLQSAVSREHMAMLLRKIFVSNVFETAGF